MANSNNNIKCGIYNIKIQLVEGGKSMMDSVSLMHLVATSLKSIGTYNAMKCAVGVGTILERELSPDEQEIIGNVFLVIGNILTKTSQYHHGSPENKWQQAREKQIEVSEIRMEILKLKEHIVKLATINDI